jgi:hypothetical protein
MHLPLRHLVPSLSASLLLLMGCPTSNAIDASASPDDAGTTDVGRDVSEPLDAFAVDSPDAPVDAFYMASCAPMQAETNLCFAGDCVGVTGAFWNGAECIESNCDCVGPECGIYATKAACDAAHTMCDAALCASTGGAWFSVPAWCGSFVCGQPNPSACETPTTACDCGVRGRFVPGVGCMTDPTCPIPERIEPETLCMISGGTWRTDICGHATCGRLSDDACVSPGCVCGTSETFDLGRGCIPNPICEVRTLGEDCTETGLCGGGATCCARGGASAETTCIMPMCGSPDGICGPPVP